VTPFASTYRVQLHAGFDFDAAGALAEYWRELGVGACYSSPIFAAVRGSTHGYDVTDPTQVNPELGGREAFDRFTGALRDAGVCLLLDIVPNHQAATTANPTWRQMLAEGPESPAGRTFDVDWSGDGDVAPGRLSWPMLGDDVDREIATGRLRLEREGDGRWSVRYHDESLPVTGPVGGPDDIVRVLDRQCYRLSQWRRGAHTRNYRRFFDVSSLAGVRVDDDAVFRATHVLVVELVRGGIVDGLRVDHVDGLAFPAQYLSRLAGATGGIYTVVEKILAEDEVLPDRWATAGTTGYEVTNELLGLFVEPHGRAALEHAYRSETASPPFPLVERAAKRQVLDQLFEPEWARVRRALLATAKAAGVDVGADVLSDALLAITVALRVYRTYADNGIARGEDRRRIQEAVAGAASEPDVDASGLGAVTQLLLGDALPDEALAPRARLLRLWQQVTGPVMAKGHEDTACYRYPVLLAQSEVGGDPGDPALGAVDRFTRRVLERYARGERGLNTTSTHDTKRSEDVRARLAVLSERPAEFETALSLWRRDRVAHDVALDEDRFVAQTLLGAWPLEAGDLDRFRGRVGEYLTKALREAKLRTSWLDPDEAHEAEVIALAHDAIGGGGRAFLDPFGALLDVVMFHGAANALAQVVVKMALPGVADVYQGTELWDFSLVDPDNRRPVDYGDRRAMLQGLDRNADLPSLCASLRLGWRSGAIKLFVTSRVLRARRDRAELFVDGSFVPLPVVGEHAENVVAFARRRDDEWALCVVPRLTTQLTRPPHFAIGAGVWGATTIVLPPDAPAAWSDVLSRGDVTTTSGDLLVSEALAHLPVALLLST
jgi:(1->4)-alpha-D-glucan 1-alpha-D-glucosylmutase